MLIGDYVSGLEKGAQVPFRLGYDLARGIGHQVLRPARYLGFKTVFDGQVQVERATILGEISTKIIDYSTRRTLVEMSAEEKAAAEAAEAAERAALPELEALQEFVEAQGPQSYEELEHVVPTAPPEPFALRQILLAGRSRRATEPPPAQQL